jgi:hypothetical protein
VCFSLRHGAIQDFLGDKVDKDMDFFEVLCSHIMVEADFNPSSLPFGFHSAGVNSSKQGSCGNQESVCLCKNPDIEIFECVLNGFVTGCSFHPERLIDFQILCCICYPSIGQTEKDFEQQQNGEVGELELSPLNWLIQSMKYLCEI